MKKEGRKRRKSIKQSRGRKGKRRSGEELFYVAMTISKSELWKLFQSKLIHVYAHAP